LDLSFEQDLQALLGNNVLFDNICLEDELLEARGMQYDYVNAPRNVHGKAIAGWVGSFGRARVRDKMVRPLQTIAKTTHGGRSFSITDSSNLPLVRMPMARANMPLMSCQQAPLFQQQPFQTMPQEAFSIGQCECCCVCQLDLQMNVVCSLTYGFLLAFTVGAYNALLGTYSSFPDNGAPRPTATSAVAAISMPTGAGQPSTPAIPTLDSTTTKSNAITGRENSRHSVASLNTAAASNQDPSTTTSHSDDDFSEDPSPPPTSPDRTPPQTPMMHGDVSMEEESAKSEARHQNLRSTIRRRWHECVLQMMV